MKEEVLHKADEALLVNYCKTNNAVAQKVLYNRYVERMMLLCLRYIPNQDDAKEVMMDSFLNFYKNIGGFTWQGEGSVRAWLTKITVNNCLMHLRKRRPLFTRSLDEDPGHEVAEDEHILDSLTVKEIMNLVQALPDGYRTVFNLYLFEGLDHKEIAGLLGISESTSKSQLHRARAMLKGKILQTS